jgi:hypothetical protein
VLGQAPETTDKPSETTGKPSEPAELKEQKRKVTKPVPGSLQDFDILHFNNIFDPNRKPYRPGRKRPDPKPEPQIDAFTLIGLMAYADRQIAVLSGSSSEYSGVFKLNDQIDNLKLISLCDKAVSFAEGEATFSVDIGTGLRRVDGGAWKESSERVRTASKSSSSRSEYSSRGTTRSDENKDSAKDSCEEVPPQNPLLRLTRPLCLQSLLLNPYFHHCELFLGSNTHSVTNCSLRPCVLARWILSRHPHPRASNRFQYPR